MKCFAKIGLILEDKGIHVILQKKKRQGNPLKGHNYEFLPLIFQSLGQLQCYSPTHHVILKVLIEHKAFHFSKKGTACGNRMQQVALISPDSPPLFGIANCFCTTLYPSLNSSLASLYKLLPCCNFIVNIVFMAASFVSLYFLSTSHIRFIKINFPFSKLLFYLLCLAQTIS